MGGGVPVRESVSPRPGVGASAPAGPSPSSEASGAHFPSALLYGAVAISMNFVNKATLSQFPLPLALLTLQMLSAVTIVPLLQAAGLVHLPPLSLKKGLSLLPLCVLYNANTALALMGLNSLNIPVYSTLKRLTPVIVLSARAAMDRRAPPASISASVALIVLGCVVTGAGDLTFDLAGYLFAFASCLLQALYLILVEVSGAERGIGSAELLLYNSLLSLPFLFVVMALTGESARFLPSFHAACLGLGAFPALLALCANMGSLLNFSLFYCTMNNSALTTTVVGVLKGVLVTMLGFAFSSSMQFSANSVVGILMNTTGGVMYTAIKHRNAKQTKLEGRRHQHQDLGPGGAPSIVKQGWGSRGNAWTKV